MLLIICLIALCGCKKNKNEIVMVTEAGFAPYEYYDNNKIVGVDVEIAKEIASALGKKLVIKDVYFDAIINEIKSGKADFALAGMSVNEERKKLTEEYTKQAVDMIETTSLMNDKVLVVYLPECHESIAGIIAGRIRERFVKPTMVVTKTVHGLKGSGRSIDAYPMYDEMTKVSDCFTKFGGHALAAGFSLEENRLEELRARLNEGCKLTEDDFVEKVLIDVPMPMDYVTMPLVEEFELLRPYGKGNPSPLFAQKDVEIISARIIGREKKFMKFKFRTDCGNFFDGIYFESPEVFEKFLIEKFDYELARDIMSGKQTKTKISVCYVPEINEYANNRTLQMQVKYVS